MFSSETAKVVEGCFVAQVKNKICSHNSVSYSRMACQAKCCKREAPYYCDPSNLVSSMHYYIPPLWQRQKHAFTYIGQNYFLVSHVSIKQYKWEFQFVVVSQRMSAKGQWSYSMGLGLSFPSRLKTVLTFLPLPDFLGENCHE